MKCSTVRVRWEHGLHLRPAARLVRLGEAFHSKISLRCGRKSADIRSIVSLLSLCAVMGATIDVEALGDDEDSAVRAVEQIFSGYDVDGPPQSADLSGPPM